MALEIDLTGRTALVTGAAGGVGREVVAALRRAGARVVAEDIDPAVRDLEGDGVAVIVGDVAESSTARDAVALAQERFGGLDVLVNNAAVFLLASLLDTEEDDWDRLLRVNVRGVYVHARAALPALIAARGAMVNVASVSGMVGQRDQAAYATTKGAIVQLTRQLAIQHAGDGVRVNAIGPGAIETGFVARSLGLPVAEATVPPEVAASHPLGRAAEPQEIAELVVVLASPVASYVTGAILMADGGLTAG